jgi:predicted DCC family thiol-disulfide oxidoreductase YuxK
MSPLPSQAGDDTRRVVIYDGVCNLYVPRRLHHVRSCDRAAVLAPCTMAQPRVPHHPARSDAYAPVRPHNMVGAGHGSAVRRRRPCRCHGVVKFLIVRDPHKVLRFASLQSEAVAPLLQRHGIDRQEALRSFIFIDGDACYRRSDAALRIAAYLPPPYPTIAAVAAWIPRPVRDAVYDCVAASRYRVFGTSDDCLAATPAIASRFLDAHEARSRRPRAE